MMFLILACADPVTCDFDTEVDAAIEGEDTDCGFADGEDGTAAWQCAIDAWTAGEAFQVRWEAYGIDSRILGARVGDGTNVWTLAQDQYGSEPWEVAGYGCVDPYEGTPEDGTWPEILCTASEPEGNHYVVCEDPDQGADPEPLPWPN